MDLPQGDQPKEGFVFGNRADKQLPIRSHDMPDVGIGKTKVEIRALLVAGLVHRCFSGDASTEAMD